MSILRAALPLAGFVLLAGLAVPVQAQDGRAVMQKMIAAYHALTSYESAASVDTNIQYGGKTISTQSISTTLKYKKPNRLALVITTPQGSRSVYSDGTNFLVYNGLDNQYTRVPTAATLPAMLPLLFSRAGVVAGLDPLYFLSQSTLPKELTGLQSKSGALNGHPVFLVTGVTQSGAHSVKLTRGRTMTIPATTRYWTWWLDKDTYLIRRLEARTPNVKVNARANDKGKVVVRQLSVTNLLRHNISDFKANSAPADSAFAFALPAGATEKRSVADLLKNGK